MDWDYLRVREAMTPEETAIDYAERIKSLSESFVSWRGRDVWNAAEFIIKTLYNEREQVRGCFCHTCGQKMPDTITTPIRPRSTL
jgi:hypothetical protein